MHIPAYKTEHDLSITYTIYTEWYGTEQINRRQFHLRNLKGDTLEAQIVEAQLILDAVAQELYHITGLGIDKGVIKSDSKALTETLYPDFTPRLKNMRFEAMLFQFSPQHYVWVKDNVQKRGIQDSELKDGWEIGTTIAYEKASFRLPVIALYRTTPVQDGYHSFFKNIGNLRQKRKRTAYGFSVHYDHEDENFVRFMDRFQETGNLSFGKDRYFGTNVRLKGRDWPKSKAKAKKYPRRSVLASKPTDDTEYVYLIQMGRNRAYKIGISNDPQKRLESMQTANPYKLKLLHTIKADNAATAEEELHRLLYATRMEGEWFKLTPDMRDVILSVDTFEQNKFLSGQEELEVKKLLELGKG